VLKSAEVKGSVKAGQDEYSLQVHAAASRLQQKCPANCLLWLCH